MIKKKQKQNKIEKIYLKSKGTLEPSLLPR
jgi:hypothetical protein